MLPESKHAIHGTFFPATSSWFTSNLPASPLLHLQQPSAPTTSLPSSNQPTWVLSSLQTTSQLRTVKRQLPPALPRLWSHQPSPSLQPPLLPPPPPPPTLLVPALPVPLADQLLNLRAQPLVVLLQVLPRRARVRGQSPLLELVCSAP